MDWCFIALGMSIPTVACIVIISLVLALVKSPPTSILSPLGLDSVMSIALPAITITPPPLLLIMSVIITVQLLVIMFLLLAHVLEVGAPVLPMNLTGPVVMKVVTIQPVLGRNDRRWNQTGSRGSNNVLWTGTLLFWVRDLFRCRVLAIQKEYWSWSLTILL